jgi:large conductance mechanosensitive channel
MGEVVNYILFALAVFVFIVKFLGWLMKLKREEIAPPPPMTKDQELLTEIRGLLKGARSVGS